MIAFPLLLLTISGALPSAVSPLALDQAKHPDDRRRSLPQVPFLNVGDGDSRSSREDGYRSRFPDPSGVFHNLGPYSPWYSSGRSGQDLPFRIPEGCKVKQLHVLHRHGARYPTHHAGDEIRASVEKIQGADKLIGKELAFLEDYEWDLGWSDLVPYGGRELVESATAVYKRYTQLTEDPTKPPFIRASGSTRVIDSAGNWTEGFSKASGHRVTPENWLVIPECSTCNNTLDAHKRCPTFPTHLGTIAQRKFTSHFAPAITARLNAAAPGADLDDDDVINLFSLCGFQSVADERQSGFCGLFRGEEFGGYEYWHDLGKYWGYGYGNPLAHANGVGYLSEVLSRITGNRTGTDSTTTNSTLNASPISFPLDRKIYVDFTHDNTLANVFTALGVFDDRLLDSAATAGGAGGRSRKGLPWDGLPEDEVEEREWFFSRMAPFSGRMHLEVLDCGDGEGERGRAGGLVGDSVRILVNDRVLELDWCDGREVCPLDVFVGHLYEAVEKGQGEWLGCFEEE